MPSSRVAWIGLLIILMGLSVSSCGPSAEDQTGTELPSTRTVTIPTTSTPVQTISLSAEDYLQEGNKSFDDNDLNSALEAYNNAIEIRSDYADAYLERGRVFAIQGVYDLAIEDLTTVIDMDPNNFVAHFLRALTYDDTGQYGLAIYDYDFVIEHDPEFAEAYLWRGRGLAMIGEIDKAMPDIELALELGLAANEEQLAHQVLASIANLRDMIAGNVNLDGRWAGVTGQGEIFEFTIDNGGISSYKVGWQIPGCEYSGMESTGGQSRGVVEGIQFTVEDDAVTFMGAFTSENTAVGTIEIDPLFCESISTTWSAVPSYLYEPPPLPQLSPELLARIPDLEIPEGLYSPEAGSENLQDYSAILGQEGDWYLVHAFDSIFPVPAGWSSYGTGNEDLILAYHMDGLEYPGCCGLEDFNLAPEVLIVIGRLWDPSMTPEEHLMGVISAVSQESTAELVYQEVVDPGRAYLIFEQDLEAEVDNYVIVIFSGPVDGWIRSLAIYVDQPVWEDYYPIVREIAANWAASVDNSIIGIHLPTSIIE